MAFSTRGWRKLVAEERVFYWQAPRRNDDIVVRPEDDPQRMLRVCGAVCAGGGTYPPTATPRVVREAIDHATAAGWPDERRQFRLVIFGPPPRVVGMRVGWLTPAVVALAHGIQSESAFDRMPVIADALEDAGCHDADILSHCRSPAPHADGCWVVGLIVGVV